MLNLLKLTGLKAAFDRLNRQRNDLIRRLAEVSTLNLELY